MFRATDIRLDCLLQRSSEIYATVTNGIPTVFHNEKLQEMLQSKLIVLPGGGNRPAPYNVQQNVCRAVEEALDDPRSFRKAHDHKFVIRERFTGNEVRSHRVSIFFNEHAFFALLMGIKAVRGTLMLNAGDHIADDWEEQVVAGLAKRNKDGEQLVLLWATNGDSAINPKTHELFQEENSKAHMAARIKIFWDLFSERVRKLEQREAQRRQREEVTVENGNVKYEEEVAVKQEDVTAMNNN